jgi:hypothetical protein
MDRGIPESDWRLFRRLEPIALDRFCSQVLDKSARIAGEPGKTSHERYLKLYKFIREQDRDLAAVFDDLRRSTAIRKLAQIYALGLLTEAELGDFTEGTRETVSFLTSR